MPFNLELDAATINELPVDELALSVLRDMVEQRTWDEGSYLVEAHQHQRLRSERGAVHAIAEAIGWLRAHGLIARSPTQNDASAIFVTRAGHAAVEEGLVRTRAAARLQQGLHPRVERRARPQFLLGEFEQAVFVAMKAIEVRVRELGGFPDELVGVDLMNQAFGPTGH